MTTKEKLEKAIQVIRTLKQDAEMALDGRWDKSDDGFEAQIWLIEEFFNETQIDD